MKKTIYITAILSAVFIISCKKDNNTAPSSGNPSSPGNPGGGLSGDIFTFAGNGTASYSGDGGAATAAELNVPIGITIDGSGNIYIADFSNNRVRVVNSSGIISTFAGNGTVPFSGDGGPATAAGVCQPRGVYVDGTGNVYIASVNRIRKVNTGGIISTIAGCGPGEYTGDGGPATAAELNYPFGMCLDASGNMYIADWGNSCVRLVNTSGIISTYAGSAGGAGYGGDGGPATAARLFAPAGVALDRAGNLYIADYQNNRVRMVNTAGIISTFAGNGYGAPYNGGYSGDGGPATSAELSTVVGVTSDGSGNVYISELGERIRKVNSSGVISTIAGNGAAGFSGDGGLAVLAELNGPGGVALDASGNIYIVDTENQRIRKVLK